MDRKRATLTGLAAILLWSTMVGLIRSVSEGLGPVGGAAMIYTVSGLLCLVTVGFPDLRRFSTRYLIAGSILFVSYEMCWPCRWDMPRRAHRRLKSVWSIICGQA